MSSKKDYMNDFNQEELVKDYICIEFSVPQGKEQTVFTSEGFNKIFSAGFISFDCGKAKFITIRFYNEDGQIGSGIQVFQDSSIAFIQTEFNRITITCSSIKSKSLDQGDCDNPNGCEGEICIRTKVSLNND
jgi:hypothetical protein